MKRLALICALLSTLAAGQEIKRPTAGSDAGAQGTWSCAIGTNSASGSMPNFFDAAGAATSSTDSQSGSKSTHFYRTRRFQSWQAATSAYSALTLKITSACAIDGVNGGECDLYYSTNSGSTWTLISADAGGHAQQTFSVTLNAAQDLSTLVVGACEYGASGGGVLGEQGSATTIGYDIWTEGTLSGGGGGGAGAGNALGNAHRGAVAPRMFSMLFHRRLFAR